MTSSTADAFGSEFLPGRDQETKDGASRAMGRRFGGQVAKPFDAANSTWSEDSPDHDATHNKR